MTSPSSGYCTVDGNISSSDAYFLKKTLPVPANHIIMVSFKELSPYLVEIDLCHHLKEHFSCFSASENLVWRRDKYDFISDFPHVLYATYITACVKGSSCSKIKTNCFHLFFSFFLEDNAPQKLSNGLWNCSVNHYARFHHHMACNHKTECDDGRDETESCSFSSPQCQGLVAFCNGCYKFVKGLDTPDEQVADVIIKGNEYCNKLGGKLSFPKCMANWRGPLKRLTDMHDERLNQLWVGFYSNDMSKPNMYRHEIFEEQSVLYHSVSIISTHTAFSETDTIVHVGVKKCFMTRRVSELRQCDCSRYEWRWPFDGLVCELMPNKSQKDSILIESVFLTSTQFWSTGQILMVKCFDGHVTHSFLLCGSNKYKLCKEETVYCNISDQFSNSNMLHLTDHHDISFTAYMCDEITEFSYTLVCDFVNDCEDNSDESLCKHPLCVEQFTCMSGQCLPYDNVCDQVTQCHDKSDEEKCDVFRMITLPRFYIPSPVLIHFNGINYFTSVPMNSSESCPDSHYRCPGEFNDCLPVYTRCNGIYDCLDQRDEGDCVDLKCPGFFRCRESPICIHSDHLCDGWPHCPMRDDELVCDVTCPEVCLCQGQSFLCFQSFSTAIFPQIRYLDATGTGMTPSDLNNHNYIVYLIWAKCFLTCLPELNLINLRILDLSGNKFQHINMTSFLVLENLQVLSLSQNPLYSHFTDSTSVLEHPTLKVMDLSCTYLTVLEDKVFSQFPGLKKLNLSYSTIHTINPDGFQFNGQLTELYMDGTPVKTFPLDIFKDLPYLKVIYAQNYKLCCKQILPYNFDESSCYAPKDEISSCEDLLHSWTYRGFLWLISFLSITGNSFCLGARLFVRSMASSSGFSVFVINLTMADLLMGVYVAMIGVADERFRGRYLHYDDTWKSSVTCKVAGFMSVLSSEVSALVIWLITLDRFLVLHFPFSTLRFEKKSAAIACLLTWLMGWFLAVIPLLPVTTHWNFYGQTGICIPLPVTRHNFRGKFYSFGVLIVFNFVLFFLISAGQALIYWTVQTNALKTNTTRMSRDLTIARRLITVAVTDFMCWFPIGVFGLLASAGVPIPGEVNVALAIFVLPLNSAANPFVYTFNILAEKRRKYNESKLLTWLESHAGIS